MQTHSACHFFPIHAYCALHQYVRSNGGEDRRHDSQLCEIVYSDSHHSLHYANPPTLFLKWQDVANSLKVMTN